MVIIGLKETTKQSDANEKLMVDLHHGLCSDRATSQMVRVERTKETARVQTRPQKGVAGHVIN